MMRAINAIIDGIKTILTLALAYVMLLVCCVIALIFPQALSSDEEIAREAERLSGEGGKWR